ncbi:MAG: hypothetical protein NEA02_10305 [Thermoanaerobaculia bacterium]|nr:hypothetical protein [Thermoanaerobaculia bacterium]
MRIPAVAGLIRRRVLVNFRVKPHVAQRLLPPGFEPKLVRGWVVVSIPLLVPDGEEGIDLTMRSSDGETSVELVAEAAPSLPTSSRFHSLAEASAFFEAGSLGYSPGGDAHRLDAVELRTSGWSVEPLAIRHVFSSFFADERLFPEGSVEFDSALLMRNVEHEWHIAQGVVVAPEHEAPMAPDGGAP